MTGADGCGLRRVVPPSQQHRIMQRLFSRSARRVASASALRRCSSGAPKGEVGSIFLADGWTLDPAVVEQHQAAQQRWLDLSTEMADLKATKRFAELAACVDKGLAMVGELGADNSPVQCEPMLLLELAQASFNAGDHAAAMAAATKAHAKLDAFTGAARDESRLAEVREFEGHILVELGDYAAAEARFGELLQWIDVGSGKAAPMVRVAAKNMRRSVLSGKGTALLRRAPTSDDVRKVAAESLDCLIDALALHVEESDEGAAKAALSGSIECFALLKDKKQAAETCDKLAKWCRRHNDEEGALAAEARRTAFE
jgi:tetratricopeptide (TPR) repeat protein